MRDYVAIILNYLKAYAKTHSPSEKQTVGKLFPLSHTYKYMHFKHFYNELTVEKHLDVRRFNIVSYHKSVMKNALLNLLSEKKMQLGVKAKPTATAIATPENQKKILF